MTSPARIPPETGALPTTEPMPDPAYMTANQPTSPAVPPLSLPALLLGRLRRLLNLSTSYQPVLRGEVVPVVIVADATAGQDEDLTKTGSNYRVVLVDLSVAHARETLPGLDDVTIAAVGPVALTAGGTFSLHIGDRDGIPFGGAGLAVGAMVELDPPERDKLAITNAAQAAVTVQLLVSMGG